MEELIKLTVQFSGGMELLFNNQTKVNIEVPKFNINGNPFTMRDVIFYVKDHLLKEREELFIANNTVRPGILVLINDTDWELEGEEDYLVKEGDTIVFISTLHGG